jgi:hypothetical protein
MTPWEWCSVLHHHRRCKSVEGFSLFFEGYINPDYDELSIELVTNPGGDTIYIAVSHIVSILRRPRRVPTDN